MALEIDLPPVVIERIFSKANEASAVAQLANNEELLSPKDHLIYNFEASPAKFHGPSDTVDKSAGDDELTGIDVPVKTLYKIMEFHDVDYDDAVGRRMINQVIEKLPGIIAESYDQSIFGPTVVPGSPFPGFSKAPVELDTDPESWLAAVDSITDAGYTPTGWILDKRFIGTLRKAAVAGSLTNGLGVAVRDGFEVAGVPAYFRNLAGNRGVVGDFNQAVVATYSGLTLEVHTPQSDYTLRKANKVAVYAGLRVGFGVATQDAFQPVTKAAA